MFGYFRFFHQSSTYDMQIAYKNYYCGTCFALDYHYGQLSRFMLSYDVVLIAIILECHKEPLCDRLKCHGQRKCKKQFFKEEQWKKVAALNILLTAMKFEDDIRDSNSIRSRFFEKIFSGSIHKAKADYPELWHIICNGYNKSYKAEMANQDTLVLAGIFAEMMSQIYKYISDGDKEEYVKAISRWLYFVDALDDYEKDWKRNEFNPLHQELFKSHELYVINNFKYISCLIKEIYSPFSGISKKMDVTKVEGLILFAIMNDTIPKMTSLILNKEKIPKLKHRSPGNVWS